MPGTRGKGQPDREIYNLFATLNQEQQREKHDISGLYEGRLRSHAQNFEGLKRKWEGFTGCPVPKKLRTSEPDPATTGKENAVSNETPIVEEDLDAKPAAATAVKKAAVSTPATLPSMPPHPDDKINVDNMIVNDLRKELKKRKLATGGRKAELQARLREYIAEATEKRKAEWAAKHAAKEEEEEEASQTQAKQVRIGSKPVEKMDVVMEDAEEQEEGAVDGPAKKVSAKTAVAKSAAINKAKEPPMESEPLVKEELVAPATISATNNQSSAVKKPAPKSALKPSKYAARAPSVHSTPQLEEAKAASKPAPMSAAKKVSESSTDSNPAVLSTAAKSSAKLQASAQKTKISSALSHTTPSGSAFKPKAVGGTGSAKLLEKKKAHAAATEARKARMAEMRQKAQSKPAIGGSATKPPSSSSKYSASSTLKKMASSSALGESKPNSILAKMREKAAAEKNGENAASVAPPKKPVAAAVKPKPSVRHGSMASPSIPAKAKAASQQAKVQPGLKPSALKNILDPANRPSPIAEAIKPAAVKAEEKPLSPMQTYEMSDREAASDSESDSESECENQRPKKAIPEWAQKANLHRALERQFADGPARLDPDKIFGEVLTCNLEEIFDKKKSRYQRRTSSGNWTRDHVTLAEKLTYKREMGYNSKA